MFPDRLVQGYRTFLDGRFPGERARYEALAEVGQSPEVMVIGCCDSRVSPEVIFDAGPGELFVVRNVANLVPPCEDDNLTLHGTSAAIQFAVEVLKVKHIVVLGHALCGGVRAVAEARLPVSPDDFIGRWMSQVRHVADGLGEVGPDFTARLRKLELAVVEHSVQQLLTFPFVRARVDAGELALHGAYFGVATGRLLIRDSQTGEFRACVSDTAIP